MHFRFKFKQQGPAPACTALNLPSGESLLLSQGKYISNIERNTIKSAYFTFFWLFLFKQWILIKALIGRLWYRLRSDIIILLITSTVSSIRARLPQCWHRIWLLGKYIIDWNQIITTVLVNSFSEHWICVYNVYCAPHFCAGNYPHSSLEFVPTGRSSWKD